MVPRPAVREEEVVRAVEVLEGELDKEVDKVVLLYYHYNQCNQ